MKTTNIIKKKLNKMQTIDLQFLNKQIYFFQFEKMQIECMKNKTN